MIRSRGVQGGPRGQTPRSSIAWAGPLAEEAPLAEPSASEEASAEAAEEENASRYITAPMLGTFFSAATPEAPAFVAEGDVVTPDTVVCIIEAMKVMNEIKAETSGVVKKVLVDNAMAVQYGQPLFLVGKA